MSLSLFIFESIKKTPSGRIKDNNVRPPEISHEEKTKGINGIEKLNLIFFPLTLNDLDVIKGNKLDVDKYHTFFSTMLQNNLQQSYAYAKKFCVIELNPHIINVIRKSNPASRKKQTENYSGIITNIHKHINKIWLNPQASDEVKRIFQLYSGKYNIKVYLMPSDFSHLDQKAKDKDVHARGGYKRFSDDHPTSRSDYLIARAKEKLRSGNGSKFGR